MTLVSLRQEALTLPNALCLYSKSVNPLKMEKIRDFKNLLDESPSGGLYQLIGVGGNCTPSL